MDILTKIKERQDQYNVVNELINKKHQNIRTIQDEIAQLLDEQKRIEGEYRCLVQIGKELNVLDENGLPIKAEVETEKEEE